MSVDGSTERTVLQIEDDVAARRALGRLLEARGIRVHFAACLREAEQRLCRFRYDGVVADYGLPDGNIEALLTRGLVDPATVIVVSGDDRSRRLAPHVAAHLLKPVDLTRLGHALDRVLERR